ncbi:MAG: L-2-amino-thiazoline-4-carboxylic acid hydrolase [Deltaproteobacteria bacterium]|nr:L-2-amino-thiazoline-4-carboxylic acid hydrolase [Deltaproteobacteria bacterium]
MPQNSDYLAEKSKIERNILKPISEVISSELGRVAAQTILDESLKSHEKAPSPSPFEGRTPITILAQRRIEIDLIKFIYQNLKDKFGLDAAKKLIGQAVINDAIAAGRQKAALVASPTNLLTFAQILPQWSQGDALKMTVLESTADILRYTVHSCRYAQMYKDMGLLELGFLVSCFRDGAFMEGYAPNVTLDRTKTIMTGDETCEFCYRASKNPQTI